MSAHLTKRSKNSLLLVTPSAQLVRRAAEAGFRVWSLWDPHMPEADLLPQVRAFSEELFLTGFTDPARLRRQLTEVTRRCGISTVLPCGAGASRLPLVEEAWRLGLSLNPPEAISRLLAHRLAVPPETPRVSVQTLTVDSCHHVVGVTAHRTSGPPGFLLTGLLHPAPLPAELRRAIERLVLDTLLTYGYRSGAAHTEVALTSDGPQVLSCQPRLGPDRIPLLTDVATGFDCEAALLRTLRGDTPRIPSARQYAEIGFFLLPAGRLVTYTGTENIAVTPWVRGARFPYAVGDRVPPTTDARVRRGYVVVEGDSPERTRRRVEQARADLITEIRAAG